MDIQTAYGLVISDLWAKWYLEGWKPNPDTFRHNAIRTIIDNLETLRPNQPGVEEESEAQP